MDADLEHLARNGGLHDEGKGHIITPKAPEGPQITCLAISTQPHAIRAGSHQQQVPNERWAKAAAILCLQGCSGLASLRVQLMHRRLEGSVARRANTSCGMSFSPYPHQHFGKGKEEPAYTRELKRHGGSGRRSALTCTRRRSLTCRSLTVSNARPLQSQWPCVSRLCLPDGFSQSLDHFRAFERYRAPVQPQAPPRA
jgi:hypothetical protein